MCSGVANPAPQTHSTIVATLIIPSGTGAIVPPTTTTTRSSSLGTSSTAISMSSTTGTSFTASTVGSPSPSSTSSPSQQASTSSTPKLSTVQIAGISLGVAGAVGLAIALVLLARCIRRRRYGDGESGLLNARTSRGFGLLKSNQNSPQFQISAPIQKTPVEMDFKRPGDRESILPSAIGLAISPPPQKPQSPPELHGPQGVQGLSKPALTLTIPREPGEPQRGSRMISTGRDSVVTEFAEDGEADSAGVTQIWRPPPSNPQSATTYYVADKWGNWVLGNQNPKSGAAELEAPSPLTRTRSERAADALPESPVEGGAPTPPRPRKPAISKLGSPIVLKGNNATGSGVNVNISPSVYSNFSAPPSILLHPSHSLAKPLPPPSTYFDLMRKNSGTADKRGSVHRRKSRRTSRVEKRRSSDSVTTIESSAGAFEYEDMIDDEPQEDLSPVVESPHTPISAGTSPVSYPKIPMSGKAAADQSTPPKGSALTLFPPPLRTSVSNPYKQPNPNLGTIEPVKTHRVPPPTQGPNIQQPLKAMTLNPKPNHTPGHIKSGSPETRPGPARPEPPPQQQQLLKTEPSARNLKHGRNNSVQTAQSTESYNSTASSLLAKRLGVDRAAALALGGPSGSLGKRPGQEKWRRDGNEQQQQQQGGAPGFVIDGLGHVALPVTPGWQPKLTPTRRGDDLFLSVH